MKYDDILLNYIGEFGWYQRVQYSLVLLPTIFVSMHVLSWTFTGAELPHRCLLDGENATYQDFEAPFTLMNISNNASDKDAAKMRKYFQCHRYDGVPFDHLSPAYAAENASGTCDEGYVWDFSEITYSAVSRWSIVCDRSWIRALVQSMYYIGQAAGSLVFGFIGDRLGRKKAFLLAILCQCVSGLLMAFVPWVELFAILRMIVGFGHPGVFMVSVVIGMELVGPSLRWIGGVATGISFAVGQIILGGIAYGVRNYQTLQLVISVPYFIFLIYWWIVPESARWLISQHRHEEADKILRQAARMNGRQLPEDWYDHLEQESKTVHPGRKYNFFDLIRTTQLRRRTLISFFCWPTVSMVYYGIGMNPSFYGGNRYSIFILSGLVEIPGVVFAGLTVNRLGRKALAMLGFFFAGLFCMVTLAIPKDHVVLLTIFVLLAKAVITMTYAVMYVVTPEYFPTVIRNIASGSCSMMARIGAVSASYLAMWLVNYSQVAVVMIFGIFSLVAAALMLLQPETSGSKLVETIADAEKFGKASKVLSFRAPKWDQDDTEEKDKDSQPLNDVNPPPTEAD